MRTSKVRVIGFLVLFVGGAICSWSLLLCAHAGDSKDAKLKGLLKERLAALQDVVSELMKAYENGAPSISLAQVLEAKQAVLDAELDQCDTDKERIAVLEKTLALAKEYERITKAQVSAGGTHVGVAIKARAKRLEVEIALERVKGKSLSPPKATSADEANVFTTRASPEFALIVDFSPAEVKPVDSGKGGTPAGDRFTVALSKQMEAKGAGFKLQRELYTLELFLRDYRLATSDGKDVDWKTAKGKVVLMNWSPKEIDPLYLKLLSRDVLILSRKK